MSDRNGGNELLQVLMRENARLRGESLVTGIILTQLLQSLVRIQLNPQAFAVRIVKEAQEAVEQFRIEDPADNHLKDVVRAAALEAVQHYDLQIKAAVPI